MILPEILDTWTGMFLVKHSLLNRSFCSHLTQTDSYRFFVKLSLLVKFIWCYMSVFSFVSSCFQDRWFFLFNVPKKRNSFFWFLSFCLWCNANIQMFLAFSSIRVNLHSTNFVFQCMLLFFVSTNYLVLLQLLFLYTSAIFTSNYGIISSNVDCTGSFLGCSVPGGKTN